MLSLKVHLAKCFCPIQLLSPLLDKCRCKFLSFSLLNSDMKSTSLSLISDLIYEKMWNEDISLYCNTIQRSRLPCSVEQCHDCAAPDMLSVKYNTRDQSLVKVCSLCTSQTKMTTPTDISFFSSRRMTIEKMTTNMNLCRKIFLVLFLAA